MKKRVAIELSGQPRGLPLCLNIIKSALIEPNQSDCEIDVFLHAWHDESKVGQPFSSAQPSQANRVGFIKPHTKELLRIFLNPKKYIIEPQREFPHLRNLIQEPSAVQELLGSNFYSVYMANELKKQYEQENGFIYDLVVRTRYDLFYYESINFMDYINHLEKIVVMEEFQNHQDWKNNFDKPMVDIFALSNSKNMDIFCGVYPNMEKLNKTINPPFGENYLGHHVRVNNNIELYKAPFKLQILHRVVDLSKI